MTAQTKSDRAVTVAVVPLDVVAQVAVINGEEIRLDQQPKRRFAVMTEAAGNRSIMAVLDDEARAIEAADELVSLIREFDQAEAATRGTLQ